MAVATAETVDTAHMALSIEPVMAPITTPGEAEVAVDSALEVGMAVMGGIV